MDGSLHLTATQGKTLLTYYRTSTDPAVRLRALSCCSWPKTILGTRSLPCSLPALAPSSGGRNVSGRMAWRQSWERRADDQPCFSGLVDCRRGPLGYPEDSSGFRLSAQPLVVRYGRTAALGRTPTGISAETIRRWLHRERLVWRRPRPVLGPKDPDYARKLRAIRSLLATLPADEAAVFQDEVDINTNPKIGAMWMRQGQQAEVETPGTNVKRYLAGSLHWRTGKLLVSPPGTRRNSTLFVAHLDELRRRLRCYRRIHVICDSASFHRSRPVQAFLAKWGHRMVIHHLPKYAPKTNPIERVWRHLHEEITRNHRCKTIDELVGLVFDWFGYKSTFDIETSVYSQALAA